MSRWLKTGAPLAIAALLLAAVAIGFEFSSRTNAAECNEGVDTSDRLAAGSSAMFTTTFCSDPTSNFVVQLYWGKFDARKDLALHITSPSGMEFFVDEDPSAAEIFVFSGPVPEGQWQVEVINQGSRSANYDLVMGFG